MERIYRIKKIKKLRINHAKKILIKPCELFLIRNLFYA